MKLNGYCMSPRGICKVTYYGDGLSIYFFDKCRREMFKNGAEPKLTHISLEHAIQTGLNETNDYLYQLCLYNDFVRRIRKEPKLPILLVPTYRINKALIQASDHYNYDNSYKLEKVWKRFDDPDTVVLNFSYTIKLKDEDDEYTEIRDSHSNLFAPESLFINYNPTDYKQWLDITLTKKIKDLNDQFDKSIEEIKKLKKSILT